MSITENCVAAYGVFSDEVEVTEVVRTLSHAGIRHEEICLMMAPTHPISAVVRDANLLNEDRGASAVTAGLIGWLSEFGAVVIPTVGFFIRSQAFLHAMLSSSDGPALCGKASTLAGLGFAESSAERVERRLRQAGFLVYLACRETEKAALALELFRQTGAEESATLTADREVEVEAVA